ncbi:hypothetical protein [Providencia alcalifaciens]|uniref:hypothetical protein n=1 Tax=Providencia alcalifaciens TaxID=126385 RepID=UPI0004508953|nr:hypothetical protein [Providencia alcalifaciens]EUD06124.1 hypothetical protein HMPREF1564_2525 [Providencia alcalifaciens R90-1475]
MTHSIMLTTPFLLSGNFLSTSAIEHDFFLSNENNDQRNLIIKIAKMMLAQITKMEDTSQGQRVIKLANTITASQSSSFSPFQLATRVSIANRFNQQNAPYITSSIHINLEPSRNSSNPPHDGILSSGCYTKIEIFHQQVFLLIVDKDVVIFGKTCTLESHQKLCKVCFICPLDTIDIKGLIQIMNFSLRNMGENSLTKQEPFS